MLIEKVDKEIINSEGALHLQFDGRIVNGKERLVVLLTNPAGRRLMRVKAFEEGETVTALPIFEVVIETFNEGILDRVRTEIRNLTC